MKTVVFLGAKNIAVDCLTWLLEAGQTLGIKILCIGTKNAESGKDLISIGNNNHIPIIFHQDEIPLCDYIISVQYHEILTATNIAKAHILAINLHLAPIPEYRGCNQFSFAIFNEEKEFGVTIHEINTRIDHGYIISEERFPIQENIWVKDLWEISNNKGIQLFKNTIPQIFSGQHKRIDWKSLNRTERIYYRKDIKYLKEIDLMTDSLKVIDKKIRACSMPGFPPPYTYINHQKIDLTIHEDSNKN